MTDVALRDYILSLLSERDKALSLLATDLTRRLDQTYVTNQGLQTRIERLSSQIVEELKVVRNEHHALAKIVAGVVSRHDIESGRTAAWATIGAYAVGVVGVMIGLASLAISLGALR